jgi:hypothetical protein
VNAAGIAVSKDIYTGNEKTALANTGAFTLLTESKYVGKADYLKRGDILLGSGHTAIVLTDGDSVSAPTESTTANDTPKTETPVTKEVKAKEAARNFLRPLAGTYKVTAIMLNVRHGAGITKKVMTTIPKGTAVKCYGYYTKGLSVNWLYVMFTHNGVTYTGFASSKYLKK